MKTHKLITSVLIFLSLMSVSFMDPAPNVPEEVFASLRTGNSKNLAKYFNASIELVILDKEGVYSQNQAEFIIKDFFGKNTPSNYVKLHEGGKDASKFVIGQLTTSGGKFRIYFLMKNINGINAIHQFRIENENN